jgi:hypothetical protein
MQKFAGALSMKRSKEYSIRYDAEKREYTIALEEAKEFSN